MKPRIITPSATAATVTAATPADGSDKQIEDSSNEELLNSGELVLEEQVIRWERFLPRRFLRVLLVENDDSTRQIVSALLRKCNYQVAAVADGLKAWAVLKKRHYKFDLVLTEVVVPPFSGISLLSKIMSNEICKTIPVIMMSSHDSMGIVFKCMLKGASDFLVKPVRKNELRNLWQHVWRKYCVCSPPQPSSGSCGDEPPSKTKVDTGSVNGLANNRGSANCGSRSKTGNNSDEGSRSQSSCRKSEAEIQSRQKLEEPLETVNRIFTEETSSEPGKHDCDVAMLATISSPIHEKGKVEDKSMEKETKVTLPVHEVVSTEKGWGKTCTYDRSLYREENSASIRGKNFSNIDNSYLLDGKDGANNVVKEIIKLIGEESSTQCSHGTLEDHTQQENIFYSLAKSPDKRATTFTSGFSPSCQLNKENEVFEAKHILNHSGSSAFSRYINGRSHLLGPETGSSSAWICSKTNECDELNQSINASSDNEKRIPFPLIEISTSSRRCETLTDNQLPVNCGNEEADPSPSLPSRTRNSVDIPSGKDISSNPHFGVIPYSIPIGSIPFQSTFAGFGTIVQPFCYPTNSMPTLGYSEGQKATYVVPPNISAQNNTLHRSPHHFMKNNHSPQIMHGVEAQRADSVPLYPRILLNPPVEILNLVKNSNFASTIASGSNGGYKEITNNETALASKNEDGSLNSNGAAFDCDRSRRETALNRFRLKRKERCFEKKVRYHNRKNLAEQRPRMKGQFVRQAVESQPE